MATTKDVTEESVDVLAKQELRLRKKICAKACELLDSAGTAANETQLEQVKTALEIYKALKPY